MEEKATPRPKSRYVWDRDKLAWVEAAEEPEHAPALVQEAAEVATREEALESLEAVETTVEAEAEAEGLQYRGAIVRAVAVVADGLVILLVNFAVRYALGADSPVANWLVPIIGAAYFTGFWAWRGQTLGKILVHAKIVKANGSPIGPLRALLRYLCYFGYLLIVRFAGGSTWVLFGIVAGSLFIVAVNRQKRGIHDLVAGTIVIDTRQAVLPEYVEEEADEGYQIPETSEEA